MSRVRNIVSNASANLASTTDFPLPIDALTEIVGVSRTSARSDHIHAHGVQTNPTLHAVASEVNNGFMSSLDKMRLADGGVEVTVKLHPSSEGVGIGSTVVPTSPFDPNPNAANMQVFKAHAQNNTFAELTGGSIPAPTVVGFVGGSFYCDILGTKADNEHRMLAYWGSYQNTDSATLMAAGPVTSTNNFLDSPTVVKSQYLLPSVQSADGYGAFIGIIDPRNGTVVTNQTFLSYQPVASSNTLVRIIGAEIYIFAGAKTLLFAVSYTNIGGVGSDKIDVISVNLDGSSLVPTTMFSMVSQGGRVEGISFSISIAEQFENGSLTTVVFTVALCGTFTETLGYTQGNPLILASLRSPGVPSAFLFIYNVPGQVKTVFTKVSSDGTAPQFSEYSTQPGASPMPTPFGVVPFPAGGCVCTGMAIEEKYDNDIAPSNIYLCGTGSGNIVTRNGLAKKTFAAIADSTVWVAGYNKFNGTVLFLTGGQTAQNTQTIGYTQASSLYSNVCWDHNSGVIMVVINAVHDAGSGGAFNFNGYLMDFQATSHLSSEVLAFRLDKDSGKVREGMNIDSIATSDSNNCPITAIAVSDKGQVLIANWGFPFQSSSPLVTPFGWSPASQPYNGTYPSGPYGFEYSDVAGPTGSTFASDLSVGAGAGGGKGFYNNGAFTNATVTLHDIRNICGGGIGSSSLPTPSNNARLIVLVVTAMWCENCTGILTDIAPGSVTSYSTNYPNAVYASCVYQDTNSTYPGSGSVVASAFGAYSTTTHFASSGSGAGHDNCFIISDFANILTPNDSLILQYDSTGYVPLALFIDPGTMQIVWEVLGFDAQAIQLALQNLLGGNQPPIPIPPFNIGILYTLNRWFNEDFVTNQTLSFGVPITYVDTDSQSVTYASYSQSPFGGPAIATAISPCRLALQRGLTGVVRTLPDVNNMCTVRFNGTLIRGYELSADLSPGIFYDIDRFGLIVAFDQRKAGSTKPLFVAYNATDIILL